MAMGAVTGEVDIDIGVGRYGLRTFKPKMVRCMPHLCSVSQEAIPNINPNVYIEPKKRELLVDTHPVAWEDGTCTAYCQRVRTTVEVWGSREPAIHDKPHEPPVRSCGCGIYALDDLRDLAREYGSHARQIVAVVSASGRTIECENGFRTAFARVVAYWVLDHPEHCTCRLCGERKISRIPGFYPSDVWGDKFPYVACCAVQFKDATRWDEPDEMVKHYGLKASPIAQHITTGMAGRRRGSSAYIDMSPITNHPPMTQGHFTFEIPYS